MDCGSKGCRFKSFFLPVNLFKFFYIYNSFIFNYLIHISNLKQKFCTKFLFIYNYYILNDLIWQEGLLIDFLQKKIIDNWVKKFLIYSAYLFNERHVFEQIIKFYLNLLIWPLHKLSIFEFNNVANILFITFIFLFFFYFLVIFTYFFFLLF